MLAPVILGVIRKKMSSDNLNASSLLDMLKGQKDNINQAMPTEIKGFLGAETVKNSRIESHDTSRGSGIGNICGFQCF